MKKIILLLIAGSAVFFNLRAQPASDILGEVDSNWPGVKYQIFHLERIAGGRLLVGVKVFATPRAPASTAISSDPENNAPFTFNSAKMIDERTKESYPVVPPNPNGPTFRPDQMSGVLHPGNADVVCIQFEIPPPPPADESGQIPKQTVSFDLPNAKGPITKIMIPPPAPAAAP